MDAIEALRSSARRYVLDRWDHWVAIYNRLPDHANRLAPNPNSHAPFYTDEQLGIFPRYQLLRQFDVDLQEVSLEGIESLNAARDALAATAESSLRTELGRISGEIPRRVMEEEYELFVDFIRLLTEDELLTVTPLRSRLGGPTSDTGEEYSREISGVVALDMTREGATLAREVIVETLDALGVNYTETLPGLWTLRLRRPRTSGLSPNCSKTRRWTLRITGDGPAALAPCIWGHLA